MGEVASSTKAQDTAAIVAWQQATGARKTLLFNELFRSKAALIRKLTQKAAFAEKTDADFEDLYQAGSIGFQRAIEDFDPSLGYAISTYAYCWIRHEIQRVARQEQRVALPRIRLTNEERQRVLVALQENPASTAMDVGVRTAQFEQVKASFGIRYVSDALPKGASAIERKLLAEAGRFDGEEDLDETRKFAELRRITNLVRNGCTRQGVGLSEDAYNKVLEYIRHHAEEAMTEENAVVDAAEKPLTPHQLAAKKSWAKRKAASSKTPGMKADKSTARKAPKRQRVVVPTTAPSMVTSLPTELRFLMDHAALLSDEARRSLVAKVAASALTA